LIFDCPLKYTHAYQKFSDEILSNTHEAAILFFDMDIPKEFMKAAQSNISSRIAHIATPQPSNTFNGASSTLQQDGSGLTLLQKNLSNIQSTYNNGDVWLMIGVFASQCNK
jgi:hypothetical protein